MEGTRRTRTTLAGVMLMMSAAACRTPDASPKGTPPLSSAHPAVSVEAIATASVSAPTPSLSSRADAPQPPASAPSPTASASAAPDVPPPCPPEMALVGRSCVDRWEATLVEIAPDGTSREHAPYERPRERARYEARSAPGVVPQAYVNRNEAQAACEAAGKRLCNLAEWYQACRGPRGFMYPYGATFNKQECNVSKPHLLSRMFGNRPGAWKYDDHFNNPLLSQEPGFLARTGEYDRCVSGYGVHDQVGNLHEWISDVVGPSLAEKIPLRDDIRDKLEKRAGNAIFMGGFYSTTAEHGRGCAFVTIGHERSYHDYSTGFRCCKRATLPKRAKKQ